MKEQAFSEYPPTSAQEPGSKALAGRTPSLNPGAGATGSPEKLGAEYDKLSKQLRHWLWAGLLPLAAGVGLWAWGPREPRAEATATAGYTFHQAGTVRGPDGGLWVWVLADSVGRARVLLSADQGHTWHLRDLGLPASRARALALGWGTPGRGLVVGDSGQMRVLADVFKRPRQGRSSQLNPGARQALFAVAADSAGQQAVVLGQQVAVQATTNGGRSWQPLGAAKFEAVGSKKPTLATTALGAFVLAAADTLYSIILTPNQRELKNPYIQVRQGVGWTCLPNPFTLTPLAVAFDPQGKALAVATNGAAQRFYLGGAKHTSWETGQIRGLRLFTSQLPVQAVVLEQPGSLDSTLLFSNAPGGGQWRALPISLQLAAIDATQAQAATATAATKVAADKAVVKAGPGTATRPAATRQPTRRLSDSEPKPSQKAPVAASSPKASQRAPSTTSPQVQLSKPAPDTSSRLMMQQARPDTTRKRRQPGAKPMPTSTKEKR